VVADSISTHQEIFNVVVVQQLQKFFEVFRKSDHIRTGSASSVQQRPAALGESSPARSLCHPIGQGCGKPRIFFHGVIDGFRGYMFILSVAPASINKQL
jgi:hypothetical protein